MSANLASYFSPNVIEAAQEHDIYITPFSHNATHLIQSLEFAVFAPSETEVARSPRCVEQRKPIF